MPTQKLQHRQHRVGESSREQRWNPAKDTARICWSSPDRHPEGSIYFLNVYKPNLHPLFPLIPSIVLSAYTIPSPPPGNTCLTNLSKGFKWIPFHLTNIVFPLCIASKLFFGTLSRNISPCAYRISCLPSRNCISLHVLVSPVCL